MNREIKFRAWDIKNSHMFYPDEDNNFERVIDGERVGSDFDYNDLLSGHNKNLIPLQFIGLKDKKGDKIFEGDVGEIKTMEGRIERFVVEWGIHRREMKSGWLVDIPGYCFRVENFPTFPIAYNYLNGHDLDIIEIIGNIYQNPELIPTKEP